MRITVYGGDARQISVALHLKEKGHDVGIFAIERDKLKEYGCGSMQTYSVSGSDAVIFPLPFSKDGINVNCPFSKSDHSAAEALGSLDRGTLIFAGIAGGYVRSAAEEYGLKLIDYYECEELQIKNAVPTAEGAIWTFMNNKEITVFGAKCTVTGCGKIGKCLSDRLCKLGAQVTVCARSERDLAWAGSMGMHTKKIEEYMTSVCNDDCIFNTVPYNIFTEKFVSSIPKRTLYIELASSPYGMNRKLSSLLGDRYVPSPSLPGATAPVTAGRIIAETIEKYL